MSSDRRAESEGGAADIIYAQIPRECQGEDADRAVGIERIHSAASALGIGQRF